MMRDRVTRRLQILTALGPLDQVVCVLVSLERLARCQLWKLNPVDEFAEKPDLDDDIRWLSLDNEAMEGL